jgi:hypothetical protein
LQAQIDIGHARRRQTDDRPTAPVDGLDSQVAAGQLGASDLFPGEPLVLNGQAMTV